MAVRKPEISQESVTVTPDNVTRLFLRSPLRATLWPALQYWIGVQSGKTVPYHGQIARTQASIIAGEVDVKNYTAHLLVKGYDRATAWIPTPLELDLTIDYSRVPDITAALGQLSLTLQQVLHPPASSLASTIVSNRPGR